MSRISLRNLALLIVLFAFTTAQAGELPLVIFFGGHGASPRQMETWQAAAKAKCGMQFDFVSVPYPAGASPSRGSVESLGSGLVSKALRLANQDPNRKIIIAGHSSGSALADEVAARISNPSRAKLVSLDGFHPSPELQDRLNTACWSSREGGLHSPNYSFERDGCGANFHSLPVEGCSSVMCMHFKLINYNAESNLGGDYVSNGYNRLDVNLDWLSKSCNSVEARNKPAPAASHSSPRPSDSDTLGFVTTTESAR